MGEFMYFLLTFIPGFAFAVHSYEDYRRAITNIPFKRPTPGSLGAKSTKTARRCPSENNVEATHSRRP